MGAPLTEALNGSYVSAFRFLLSLGKTRDIKSRDWQVPRLLSTYFPAPFHTSNCQSKGKTTAGPTKVFLGRIVAKLKAVKRGEKSRQCKQWRTAAPSRIFTHSLCLHFIIKQKWKVFPFLFFGKFHKSVARKNCDTTSNRRRGKPI